MREVRPLRERRGAQLVLLCLFVLVNLPLAHGTWTDWRLDHDGRRVIATVTGKDVAGARGAPEHVVRFRFDRGVDPDQHTWSAPVDAASYEALSVDGPLAVRVVPGHPGQYRVQGQVRGHFVLVLTLVLDLLMVGVVLLLWRFAGPADSRTLRLVALADVERGRLPLVVDPVDDGFEIVGEVVALSDGRVELDAGGRRVVVDLAGHHNPVGYQQYARVRGRPVG